MGLLNYFNELSLRPENVARLRELVLQLAVQGRLTAQWRKENPELSSGENSARQLLKAIQAEKAHLIKEGKFKKEKPLPLIKPDEIPYDLPEGWEWCRLGDLGECQTGATPPKNNPLNFGDYLPFIGPGNIKKERIINIDQGLSKLGLEKGRLFAKGSILMVCIGGSIGKMAINEGDISCNQQINGITPSREVSTFYLGYNLRCGYFQEMILDKSSGSATPIINKGKWQSLPIALPPQVEQQVIVEKVEALMAELDELEQKGKARLSLKEQLGEACLYQLLTANKEQQVAAWQQLNQQFGKLFGSLANVKKLRESILQLAVQGRLTAQWRKENPKLISGEHSASQLLKDIQAEKARLIKEGKIKKEKPLPSIERDEIPYELPEGWEWCRLGDITEKLGAGSTPKGGKSAYQDSGISFLRSQNVYNDGLRLKNVAYIPNETHVKMAGTHVQRDDILLNITGASIGRSALVPDSFQTANVSQHVAIVRLVDCQIKRFIHLLIISPYFQNKIMDVQVGVSREGLSMTKLRRFIVPLPSLKELEQIVFRINSFMQLCDQLEEQIMRSEQLSHASMEALVAEALEPRIQLSLQSV